MLNKQEMTKKMYESEKGLTKAAAARLLDLVLDSIKEAVIEGDGATFAGFGSFKAVDTAPRAVRNIATKELMQVPAGKRIKFQAGKNFKQSL